MTVMENKMIAEIDQEIITSGINILLKDAFNKLQDERDPWSKKNPFSKYLGKVMNEKEEEIKKILGDYVMEVIESDDFRLAVKSEYAKMLAKAMLNQMQNR